MQNNNEVLSQLASAITSILQPQDKINTSRDWQYRQVVVCMANKNDANKIAASLGTTQYKVIIGDTAEKTLETIQDIQAEIIVLDPQFDAENQGGLVILRHVNSMMPKSRRRTYLILVSPQFKTSDTHLAFLNGVNLVVNNLDLDSFNDLLEKSIRDFNHLYRSYNTASGLLAF